MPPPDAPPAARETPSPTVRGAIAGAVGGAAAGLLDHLLAAEAARQFLPDGTARLGVFLVALYAGAGAAAGALGGLLVALLRCTTDLAPLWRSAFPGARQAPEPREGARWSAYAAGALAALAAHGAMVWGVTFTALLRFHGKFLIAALVGASAAGLAVPAALVAFLVAAALSPALRFGPRLRPVTRAPGAARVASWLLGLGAGGFAAMQLVAAMQQRPRMTPAIRALNVALFAPAIVGGALLLAHLVGRRLLSRLGRRGPLARPAGVALLILAVSAAATASALGAYWSIAKLLPLRALAVGATAIVVAAAALLAGIGRPFDRRPAWARALVAVGLPALGLVVATQQGRSDRVRKAAMTDATLAAPLLDGLHGSLDLDRDGYPLFGGDCDDLDPEVHPGAFDWPDDGIDQNCNGHQATARPPPRPPFPTVPASVPRRPNVVLISIDALRADHVGAYGYARPTTPRIDALARESVLFRRAWAHSPSTRYSVPAILTGRYESTIAWGNPSVHWPPQVLPENRLMSEMFQELGYHTGALTSAHYFDPAWGLTQGFDDYDNSLARLHANPFGGDPARATGSSSKELADLAVRWIGDAAKQQKPFFVWMHFYDPHYLYERHPDCAACDFGSRDVDLYDGEVRYTDEHLGRVLDAIRAAGAWENTIVIVTADHGEGFGEHGVRQHGYHVYVQQTRVPLIVRVPGIAPRTVEEPVGHVDLFPTLLNLLRAPDEPQLLGTSLVDLMLGDESRKRLVFEEVDYEGPTSRKAVASRDWQLIANVVPDGTFELYHLAVDPNEERDVYDRGGDEASEQRRLRAALAEWMDEIALPPDFATRVAGNVSSTPLPASERLGAELRGDGRPLLAVEGVDRVTRSVRPGETAEVDFVLRAPARLPSGWRLFTHAVPSRGPGFLNLDHDPVEGFVPLARLRPGQWVRDRIRFTVPPAWRPGTITVELGLFRGRERARVHTETGPDSDAVRASIAVAP